MAFDGRSQEDQDLLAARIYYDAVEDLRAAMEMGEAPDLTADTVRGLLSEPFSLEEQNREAFDELLLDTQNRMQVDSEFRSGIHESMQIVQGRFLENLIRLIIILIKILIWILKHLL